MAKGMKCRVCGTYMFALDEEYAPKGTWVTYQCRNQSCGNTEKVFESNE